MVTDLVRSVLGPRNGINEEISGKPISEYITGILAPQGRVYSGDEDPYATSNLNGDSRTYDGDDREERDVALGSILSPVLDPKKMSSSMGISFFVSADESSKEIMRNRSIASLHTAAMISNT